MVANRSCIYINNNSSVISFHIIVYFELILNVFIYGYEVTLLDEACLISFIYIIANIMHMKIYLFVFVFSFFSTKMCLVTQSFLLLLLLFFMVGL
jgi:hypothetical protein